MNDKQEQPVSMEPEGAVIEGYESERIIHWRDGFMPSVGTKLYTATQLAQARQQGAEEIKEAAYNKLMNSLEEKHKRIAELEQKNAVFLEVLKRARDTAMKYTLVARIPECGHFGGIAQDLDYVYSAIAEVKP